MFEIGNSLREARLRRQLDFRQLEQATKIRSRYLRALEEEDFEALPAETYVRGFLRSYAEFLGLDGQLYVDEYNSRYVTDEESARFRPRRSPPSRRPGRGLETNVVLLALTAIAVLTALVIAAWKFSATPTDKPAAPIPKASAPAATTKATLLITAVRGSCWLEVQEIRMLANGERQARALYQGTLEKGQSQRFVAKRLWVRARSPGNLAVRLNGESESIGSGPPVVVLITANSITAAQPQA